MKIRFLLIPAAIIALISFASCKKNSVTNITKVDTVTNTLRDTVIKNTSDTVKITDTATHNVADTLSGSLNGTAFIADVDSYYQSGYGGSTYFNVNTSDASGNYYYFSASTLDAALTAKTYGASGDVTTSDYIEVDPSAGGYNASDNSTTITITSIVGAIVKGTFTGTLYPNGDNTQPGITITNGQFTFVTL